ncbi:hypothetical protein AJ80_01329 [Polytolypa hystricis UAMH7299]|uniref:Cell pattern formation-associated protein stuA n=1 Tax=Polytolypa hystricis (strain UAMH7299) TaxID=1447883 RepID=A0A2B7Z277_POLH7|nr:hypothetical protein AJ80_01329 [Polytolypa hystricis UAMH7299]
MRSLPKRLNPLILPEASPQYEELLSRRRLGQTTLAVKPGQIGTSNATKPENLGVFEYAHLKAPLPKDLKGSEIFPFHHTQKIQETYFLMRRSKDGYVSATGMFKIAFPWALQAEEKSEREYLKARSETSEEEVAGNVWISPELALELAEDYGMLVWVRALLDPTDISLSAASADKNISPPPKFKMPPIDSSAFAPPPSLARSRGRRSASPTKFASPAKKLATPRRPRQTRAQKESSTASSSAANADLQSTLDAAASTGDSTAVAEKAEKAFEVAVSVNGTADEEDGTQEVEAKESKDKVKVNVTSTTETSEDVETTRTDVSVDMPAGLPDLPLPEDTAEMIAKAKEMVEEANKLQQNGEASEANPASNASKKRKSDEVEKEGEESDAESTPAQPAKKARILEDKLRRERVRNRALVGVTATLAIA